MTTSSNSIHGHSSEYFGAERDHFWNDDYLDLLACRLKLKEVASIADVGCGVGHWGALLYSRLAPNARLVGIDRDAENVAGFLMRRARTFAADAAVNAVRGTADALPLPDKGFDAATCQTLLIHLEKPMEAIREMTRITRPGGLVFCAEPNNSLARFPSAWALQHMQSEQLSRLSQMACLYSLGRNRRGLGQEYLGELLPGMLAKAGLVGVRVWLCDKTTPMIPPYSSLAEREVLASYSRWRATGVGPFDREDARANVLAGGGTDTFFEAAWTDYLAQDARIMSAIERGQWHSAAGSLFYLAGGRVPA